MDVASLLTTATSAAAAVAGKAATGDGEDFARKLDQAIRDAGNAVSDSEETAQPLDRDGFFPAQVAAAIEAAGGETTDDEAGAAPVDPSAVMAGLIAGLTAPPTATPDTKPEAQPAAEGAPATAPPTPPAEAAAIEKAGKAAARGAEVLAETPPGLKEAESAPKPEIAADPAVPEAKTEKQAEAPSPAAVAGATPTQLQQAVAPVAHAATASRSRPVPLEPEALGLAIARHAAEGEDVFDITLTPDELGRIDVRLQIGEDGRISAHIQADRPETLSLLQRDRTELARALGQQGMNADQSSLQFSLRDGQAGQQGQAQDNGQGQARRQRGRGQAGGGVAALETIVNRPPAGPRSRAIDIAV